jgi:hypothetical protein
MADDLKAMKQDDEHFHINNGDEVKYWAEWCLPLGAKQDAPSGVRDADGPSPGGVGSEP